MVLKYGADIRAIPLNLEAPGAPQYPVVEGASMTQSHCLLGQGPKMQARAFYFEDTGHSTVCRYRRIDTDFNPYSSTFRAENQTRFSHMDDYGHFPELQNLGD